MYLDSTVSRCEAVFLYNIPNNLNNHKYVVHTAYCPMYKGCDAPPLSITAYLIGKVVTHAGIIHFVHRTVSRMYDVFMVIKVILFIVQKYCLTSGNR